MSFPQTLLASHEAAYSTPKLEFRAMAREAKIWRADESPCLCVNDLARCHTQFRHARVAATEIPGRRRKTSDVGKGEFEGEVRSGSLLALSLFAQSPLYPLSEPPMLAKLPKH